MEHGTTGFGKIAPLIYTVFVIAALVEVWLIRRRGESYDWKETAASVGVSIGQRIVNATVGGMTLAVFFWIWEHRLWTIPMKTWWSYVLLFFALEFAYYWFHRASHECRWFWATHSVHHSPQKMYLIGAARLGWTGQVTGAFLFYAPLVWIGFHPLAVLAMLLLNLVYQFWLHTELVGSLGWFDRIFNSPSNHRVHHAINPVYLDRNHGGVIMLFDHLFGTYEAERSNEPPRYGLVKQIESHNPFRIAFNEWIAIARDLRGVKKIRDAAGYLFAAPGWAPDGHGMTSERIRAFSRSHTPHKKTGLQRHEQN
jgi:sterol desaturase/sphingolipid hydroxylase (fatty acid hydroxylase superfamily)